jgi:hypothetical protein
VLLQKLLISKTEKLKGKKKASHLIMCQRRFEKKMKERKGKGRGGGRTGGEGRKKKEGNEIIQSCFQTAKLCSLFLFSLPVLLLSEKRLSLTDFD